jgi:hypothetical protein
VIKRTVNTKKSLSASGTVASPEGNERLERITRTDVSGDVQRKKNGGSLAKELGGAGRRKLGERGIPAAAREQGHLAQGT